MSNNAKRLGGCIAGAGCAALLLTLGAVGGIVAVKYWPASPQASGSRGWFKLPEISGDVSNPVERDKYQTQLSKIAAHKFWKKKPSTSEVDRLLTDWTGRNANTVCSVDEKFESKVLTDRMEAINFRVVPSAQQLSPTFASRYIWIDLAKYSTRPDKSELARKLLEKLDEGEFQQPPN